MLLSGKPIEASEVLNSELIRRLSEPGARRCADNSPNNPRTLLGGHPRIKELKAQLADLDRQVRDEAGKVFPFAGQRRAHCRRPGVERPEREP